MLSCWITNYYGNTGKYWKTEKLHWWTCLSNTFFFTFLFFSLKFPSSSNLISLHFPLFPLFLSLLLDYYMSLSFHSPSCLITFFLYSSLQQPYKFIVADVAMRENRFCVHLQTLQIPAALVLNDFTGRRVAASPIILHFSEDLVQFVIIFLTLHFFFLLLLNYFVFFFLFTFYFSLCNITL